MQAALVVDALEVVKVGDEHVVALVHGHNGADGCTCYGIAAWHAGVIPSVGTSSIVYVVTYDALWLDVFVAHGVADQMAALILACTARMSAR